VADRPHRLTQLAMALLAAAVVTGGCAELPTGGAPQSAPARPALGGGDGGCCGLIVRGPQPTWDPYQIVSGFLLASAKPEHDFALARQYLAPGTTRNSWRPGSEVTILTGTPKVSRQRGLSEPNGGGETVVVTGREMATLKGEQYTPAASGGHRVNGQSLISQLPANGLLLTDQLFHLVYTARDVYYDGLRNAGPVPSLVPSPVFIPTDANLAEALVSDLLQDPPGELRNVMNTSFPPGTKLESVQTAPGKTAIVNLHLPHGNSPRGFVSLARQLVATLTSAAYGPRLFQGVKMRINGTAWPPRGSQVLTPATPGLDLPHPAGAGSVYYVAPAGGARTLSREAASGVPVPGDAGSGHVPLGDVAVSPDGRYLAGIAKSGDEIYTADLRPGTQPGEHSAAGQLHKRQAGVGFTSLSWDNQDDLWLVGQISTSHVPGVWVMPNGRGNPVSVTMPADFGRVTSIRVAPDGNRVAMVVGRDAKAHMELGYIMHNGPSGLSVVRTLPLGPSLLDVTAIAWFDEDHLVAAAHQGPSGAEAGSSAETQLWEVPVDGDSATTLHTPQPAVTAIAAAGPQNALYLTSNGRLLKSVGLGEPWNFVTAGQAADYPG
jgi:hypothetical protein